MHPVEEYQDIIALTVDKLNESEIVTPMRRRWTLNYHITQCTGNSVSWRQDAVEKVSTQQREPSGPQLSSCSWRQDAVEKANTQLSEPSGPRLISWGSDKLENRCGRENQHPERLDPRPLVEQPRRMGKKHWRP